MTQIFLHFDGNPRKIVWAGQLVTGHVHIEAREKIKMRGIRLELRGSSFVFWTKGYGKYRISYSGSEDYMNQEIYLTGSRNNPSELFIEPGCHNFPFSFSIPPELPRSYESIIGQIRYTAKVVIDRPMRINNTTTDVVTVLRLLDLNKEPPLLREPFLAHGEKEAAGCCCSCCISGAVEMNLWLNKRCFIPGETILVSGDLSNRSNRRVTQTIGSFVQKITYFGNAFIICCRGSTERVNVLSTIERPGLEKGQSDSFRNIGFRIPLVYPSRLDGCSIIDIVYYIELRSYFDLPNYSVMTCEVVIGNVPIRSDAQPPVVTNQPTPLSLPQDNPPSYLELLSEETPLSLPEYTPPLAALELLSEETPSSLPEYTPPLAALELLSEGASENSPVI